MLSKLQNMGQSLRDVTHSIAAKATTKINEIQKLPEQLPEAWDERIDENGKPYYVDTETGEWYRVKSKTHKRIDTNEKIHILTAESKKEFDDQKKKMESEDEEKLSEASDSDYLNDLPSDTPSDQAPDANKNKKSHNTQNGHTTTQSPSDETSNRKRAKSNHSKRSSTSVSKGWQCEKCTLENVGHAQTCNACLAPRPERPANDINNIDEDEDEMAINGGIQAMEEQQQSQGTDEESDDLLNVPNNERSHQQMDTLEAINSAVDASLEEMGGKEIKTLTSDEKRKLINFMDFVETEPDPSIKYLRESNWDIQMALDAYLRQHPDHPKSRGGSLQFDLAQLNDILPQEFEADIELPDDIVAKTKAEAERAAGSGRRDSTELDEVPNGDGHGARDSDEDVLDHSDSDSDKEEISYADMNNNNGVRHEYAYEEMNNGGMEQMQHRRMNTDQEIQLAEQLSVQQSDFDSALDKYRKEVESLKAELKEQVEENEQLRQENEELNVEKERYAIQSREIQNDWDRMSGYMSQILGEVAFIEERRKKGEDISTPTPKLNNIFQAIQHTISRNNNEDDLDDLGDEEHNQMMEMMDNTQQIHPINDMYENVADLFTEEEPVHMEKTPVSLSADVDNKPVNRKRKLSFGAVNELFLPFAPDGPQDDIVHNDNNANNFLSVAEKDAEEDKRLSYGGVGLLFKNNEAKEFEQPEEEEVEAIAHVADGDKLNNMNFKPTYDGIASLFDESNNILDGQHNKGKVSFAGDIVELFQSPEDEYNESHEEEAEEAPAQEYESEESDSMDEQRVYTYSDDEDENEANEDAEEEDEDKKEHEQHKRYESYTSNMSDPTPLSRRGSKSGRKHSRGPSFAFKDLFRDDDDNDSEDRAPSVQSAPEEHDYYAITAYYGIEDDDDATGWDSRRSSMFGDYGLVHSRRQSKRVQSQMVTDNIKDMFKVDLTNKLAQHLSVDTIAKERDSVVDDADNVADLFDDSGRKSKNKQENKMQMITEEVGDDVDEQMITDNAHVVADLFEPDISTQHQKKDTYSGVKQLFGRDESESEEDIDIDDEEEDYDDDDMENIQLSAKLANVPRPSTNAALGSTFDSITMRLKPQKKSLKKDRSREEIIPETIEEEKNMGANEDEIIARVREEEQAKLTVIEQELRDTYDDKMRGLRNEIERETDERLRGELTRVLTENLTPKIESECRKELESEMNSKLETQLNERIENEVTRKVNEMEESFDSKIEKLKKEMNERENVFQEERTNIEQSKCELIQHTAKEIDSLRSIIKNYFDEIQTLHNNLQIHRANNSANNGMFSSLLNSYNKNWAQN